MLITEMAEEMEQESTETTIGHMVDEIDQLIDVEKVNWHVHKDINYTRQNTTGNKWNISQKEQVVALITSENQL